MVIYLDNNATTSMDSEVINACIKEMKQGPSNPSSIHTLGKEAKARLLKARDAIASAFHALPHQVLFTSGSTESINLLLKGKASLLKGRHIITSSIEHSATLSALAYLEKEGVEVSFLSPGEKGYLSLQEIETAKKSNTSLIFLSAANNETGVINQVEEIACFAKKHHLTFIVDGTAFVGKAPLFSLEGVSAFLFSGHKIHGPKGIGAIILKEPFQGIPLITGGSQEYQIRAGTENLIGIIGLAKAVERLSLEDITKVTHLRHYFESELQKRFPIAFINGDPEKRVSNTSNIYFQGYEAELLLMQLDLHKIAVSFGSACASGTLAPSHVLIGMGYSKERALSSLRFSLSRYTTKDELDHTLLVLSSLL